MVLLTSPLPLAYYTGLDIRELLRDDANVLEDASLLRSQELTLVEPLLQEAPFEEFCGDIMMDSAAPNVRLINSIYTESLDLTPTSSPLLLTTRSHLHVFMSPQVTLENIILTLIHIVHT